MYLKFILNHKYDSHKAKNVQWSSVNGDGWLLIVRLLTIQWCHCTAYKNKKPSCHWDDHTASQQAI